MTYPTMLDRVLSETSSYVQSQFPSSGVGESLLNNPSHTFNAATMDSPRQSITPTPQFYRDGLMLGLGTRNHQASSSAANFILSAEQHWRPSGLLHYSRDNAATEVHRSALFSNAYSNLARVNASMMNRLALSQVLEQQHLYRPGVSQLKPIIASGLSNSAMSESLRLASEFIMRNADLPSVSRPLDPAFSESAGSIAVQRSRALSEVENCTHLVGSHDFFPMVLHRALMELELLRSCQMGFRSKSRIKPVLKI